MEHAQRESAFLVVLSLVSCLNPYFNGTCSKRKENREGKKPRFVGLNPYFNGTCSKRGRHRFDG